MRKVKDYYFKKAKEEQYAARSVYKLMEVDKKYRLLHNGISILDLGCSPGSWSQYILKKIGKGRVIGVDLGNPPRINDKRFLFIKKDIFLLNPDAFSRRYGMFDLITSDVAPQTSGDRFSDGQISLRMFKRVFTLSHILLKEGGNIVAKVFQCEGLDNTLKDIASRFKNVYRFKPKSSRKESREIYIVALSKKGRQ